MRASRTTIAVYLFLMYCGTLSTAVPAQDVPVVHFIFDASAHMSVSYNDGIKLDFARRFIRDIVNSDLNADYGLTVFGGGESLRNDAFFTPIPPGPGTGESILFELDRLNAAGKSPIASAVRSAGRSLDPNRENYLVLVSECIENTGGAPVSAVSDLMAGGIVRAMHIAGFIPSPDASMLVQGMLDAGGGLYYGISDAQRLLAELQPAPATDEAMQQESGGILGYRCFVMEENGFPAYGTTVTLLDGSGKTVAEKSFWRGIFDNLEPGRYTITAKNGATVKRETIEVRSGRFVQTPFVFTVRTGGLEFEHLIQGTSQGKAFGTITRIFHESGETVYTGTSWTDRIDNLPAGEYTIEGYIEGLEPQQKKIRIEPGQTQMLQFYFNMGKGRIAYKCFLDSLKNIVASGTQIRIFRLPYSELALEASQWRGTTSYLPYGGYEIEGNYKGIIRKRDIYIKPDSTLQLDFVFNIRQARFTYRCFEDESIKSPATGTNVLIINEMGRVVEEENRWSGTFLLPEGKYTLQATYNGTILKRSINLFAGSATAEEDIYFNK